jgi:SAM-dependent methyltransferase
MHLAGFAGKAGRYIKYVIAAPLIDAAINLFPALSAGDKPPDAINFAGGGDFNSIGDANVQSIIQLADLKDGDVVVEIGCAIGRNVLALHRHFADRVQYMGFDIVRYGITWCRRHFSRSNQYRFLHADIYNSFYNPRGRLSPAAYRFPADDASADVVFSISVFTHMQRSEVDHYISETARITRLGGRCYFTFFLLDDESERAIQSGVASLTFPHQRDGCRIENAAEPDMAVAYPHPLVESMLRSAGFELLCVHRSSWRGLKDMYYQDIVVASKIR